MITIVLLFAVAAIFGLTIPILQGKTASRAFVFIHGGIAATALVMLLFQFFKEGTTTVKCDQGASFQIYILLTTE